MITLLYMTQIVFVSSLQRAFKLYRNSILGCQVIQGFDLCKLSKACDVTVWIPNDVRYGISVQIPSLQGLRFCRVDVLQELHILLVNMMSS